MINRADIIDRVREWGLREDVIEKDYVLGWLIDAIASDPDLSANWVFKGGTALRKCFYETYRFSEDLDFTVVGGGPEEPAALAPIFDRISRSLYERSGIELVPDETSFVPPTEPKRESHDARADRVSWAADAPRSSKGADRSHVR